MKETTERKMNKRLLAAILFPALILAVSFGIKISAAAEADGGVSAAVTHSSTPGPEAPEKAKGRAECICIDTCGGRGNVNCPLCRLMPERCRVKTHGRLQPFLIELGIAALLLSILPSVLLFIRPVFLFGKKEEGNYRFAGVLFVEKKYGHWQILLCKPRYDSFKTGEFRLQCGLWGYFHEGDALAVSLENIIFKKIEVSAVMDFKL